MANGGVSPAVVRGLTALLAVAAVVGFAALSIYGFIKTLQATNSAPSLNDAYLYVTAALSSLVGGVVAVAFGQKPPPGPGTSLGSADGSPPATQTLLSENATSLTRVATGRDLPNVGTVIGSLYAITYVAIGLVAIVLWIVKQDLAADPVKALAATFLGLVVPIVRGYFR